MSPKDNIAALQGSIVELFWPDDGLWYRAEILALNTRGRSAKARDALGYARANPTLLNPACFLCRCYTPQGMSSSWRLTRSSQMGT
jgi:hypothetical protein